MDEVRNPFAPGAGNPPPELAGRKEILNSAEVTLGRLANARWAKSQVLVGLRGVGKTVLLNKIQEKAEELAVESVLIEAPEGKPLAAQLLPQLRKLLVKLDRGEKVDQAVKRAIRVLASFANGIRVKHNELELGFGFETEEGVADSGDLDSDLPELFTAIANAAKSRSRAAIIIIDEIQYLEEKELQALITALHRVSQKNLPFILIGGGLPQIIGKMGESKSYSERLFDFPKIGPLSQKDAEEALKAPAKREGVNFTKALVKRIVSVTEGYPYFLQEWGYQAWNVANRASVGEEIFEAVTARAIERLDQGFFRVRFDRLTKREKDYLRAMAALGPGPHRSGQIADVLGVKVESVAPFRSSLITKGMIYSPQHGDTAFTVPLFDQYMKRIIPTFKTKTSG